ncbi:AAA family ATPase [Bacillus thuringiensis]|uniref:AAA family ATPase n=1 Tax=Bacillus thuringiensis TaxID=1428 RepID=UPI0036F0BD6A
MELLSIWIQNDIYPKGKMVNLGGEYEFKLESNGTLKINENKDYFPEFFDRDKGNSKLVNVSAVVGQNGTGKSILLDCILSDLKLYATTSYPMLAVLQNSESGELIIYHSLSDINYEQVKDKINRSITVINKKFSPSRKLDNGSLLNDLSVIYFSNIFDASIFRKDLERKEDLELRGVFDISTNYLLKQDINIYNELGLEMINRNNVEPHRITDFFRQYKLLTNNEMVKNFIDFDLPSKVRMRLIKLDGNWLLRQWKNAPPSNSIYKLIKIVNSKAIHSEKKRMPKFDFALTIFNAYFYILISEFYQKEDLITNSIINVIDRELEEEIMIYDVEDIKNIFIDLRFYFEHESNASDGKAKSDFYQLSELANDALKLLSFPFVKYHMFNLRILKSNNKNQFTYEDFWKCYAKFNAFIPIYQVSWGNLSSGQKALLNVFSRFYSLAKESLSKNLLILIDEGDIYFHPQWQKRFVKDILMFLTNIFTDKNIQIILTSHSPFVISDLPPNNVILLGQKSDKDIEPINEGKPTFAANFHTLFADSFFIKGGLIGDYAKDKINETIQFLKYGEKDREFAKYAKNFINLIGEPVIREKLTQMYFKYLERVDENSIDAKILELENQVKILKEKRDRSRFPNIKDESNDSNK